MADYTYKNTPWGDITVHDSDPQWYKDMWQGLLGIPPLVFRPEFEPIHYSHLPDSPPQPLNPDYYATEVTAIEVMKRLGAVRVASVKMPYTEPQAWERWIVFSDGIAVNAGVLAKHFVGNPEDVALQACQHDVAGNRDAGIKLPAEGSLQ